MLEPAPVETPIRHHRIHPAISEYAFLSDCRSGALVSRRGSIDWLCWPRFDSPSIFGQLLDENAGAWSISPAGEAEIRRRYLANALVLETTFRTPHGEAVLRDALVVGPDERGHALGAGSPGVLARSLTCTRGSIDLEVVYAPRPEFGLVYPLLVAAADGTIAARGGPHQLILSTSIPLAVTDSTASARFTLRQGERAAFALQHAWSWERPTPRWTEDEIARRLDETIATWNSWSALHQNYQGPWRELVHHSGRVLQGLTFQPTGALIAALTTSLPEHVGGPRNWDYRYSWVRDASLGLAALWIAACPDEAAAFFNFLTSAALTQVRRDGDLQIMYGVGGEHDLAERELPYLSGWRGSQPVRIGNGAWNQRQLDVYGELMLAVYTLREKLALEPAACEFLIEVAETACARWREPDQGIWEMRGAPQHFVHSKLMCWVAVDRAIKLVDLLGAADYVAHWTRVREDIRREILAHGWSASTAAFSQSFDSELLDASALQIPLVGFLPADDPRVISTLAAIERDLADAQGLIRRYRGDDGLRGPEGSFLLCTFWLSEAQARAGQLDAAKATFERAAAYLNDVGLLSEEVDSATRELLGNFPQAFSHIGLVNAAWAISEAELAVRPPPPSG